MMMKSLTSWIPLLAVFFSFSSCLRVTDDNEKIFRTVTFINKTGMLITVKDNSNRELFEDIVVEGHSGKKLTYACPETGSCDFEFKYVRQGEWKICICIDGTIDEIKYTFGYCTDNEEVEPLELCSDCLNSVCD